MVMVMVKVMVMVMVMIMIRMIIINVLKEFGGPFPWKLSYWRWKPIGSSFLLPNKKKNKQNKQTIFTRVTHITFISRIIEHFLSFPDDAVQRGKLGIKIHYSSLRNQLNQYISLFLMLLKGNFKRLLNSYCFMERVYSD